MTSHAVGTATTSSRGDDADDEQHRVDDEAERRGVPEDVERLPAAVRDPDHEVCERQQEERDHAARCERERGWRPPARGGH